MQSNSLLFKLSKWGIWKWGVSRKRRGKGIKKRALRSQMSHLDRGAVVGCFECAVSMAWSSSCTNLNYWEAVDGGRGIFCRQPEPLPEMRANIAVFWSAGGIKFKWAAQVFFRIHFFKNCKVLGIQIGIQFQNFEKNLHISSDWFSPSHITIAMASVVWNAVPFILATFCVFIQQSLARFCNQACIEKRVLDISIL